MRSSELPVLAITDGMRALQGYIKLFNQAELNNVGDKDVDDG